MKSSENSFETPEGCLSCSTRIVKPLFRNNWKQTKTFKGPFNAIKKQVPKKKQFKNTNIAKILCFRDSGRRFCFGRGFDVYSMFWICVVQVEQMNKKVAVVKPT